MSVITSGFRRFVLRVSQATPAMMAAKMQELLKENARVIQELGRENEEYKKRIEE